MKNSERAAISVLALIAVAGTYSLLESERFRPNAAPAHRGRSGSAAPTVSRSLPYYGFRVEWQSTDAPMIWKSGQSTVVHVTFKNASPVSWPDPGSASTEASGAYAVRLSYGWAEPGMNPPRADFHDRADLDSPLPPGATVTLPIRVTAPSKPGDYELDFDLVQELVAWFRDKGSSPLTVPVKVTG